MANIISLSLALDQYKVAVQVLPSMCHIWIVLLLAKMVTLRIRKNYTLITALHQPMSDTMNATDTLYAVYDVCMCVYVRVCV